MTSADRVPRDEAAADRHADKPAPRQPDVAETLRRSFQERLEAVFVEACDLAPEACDAFLQRACADDEALRAAVAEMLHEAREPDPILAQPPFGAALRALAELRSSAVVRAGGPPAPPDVEAPGATFGEFELIERLGEGGFATVYRARQRGSVRRDVALKIPRPGLDASLMARFLAERQALAGMNEEHLAQFLEAGETPTGRPFFTMELVEGEPITDFCDRHALSIGDRLELFLQVCEAIQHAHQKGVIHRDLKPANVLATMRGEQPFAKVIDFGIARPTDDARAAGGAHAATTLGQFLGTPGYMSPEQVRTASDVDTRSDVYALGILLYELLTGRTPLAWAGLQGASLAEVQRFTCEVDPGRPSMRLRAAGPALAALAASRAAAPTRLVASIRGDLDRIVLKAIETDPRRRYATVAELGADVRRFLRAEPILAQPPTARYVLGKFVRRHRGAVIAASAIALSLVAGLVVATVGLVKAERRARETKEVADFQGEILRDIDIGTQGVGLREDLLGQYRDALRIKGVPPEEVDVRVEVLRRELEDVNATDTAAAVIDRSILAPAAASIDRKFAAQPLVAASLRQTVADAYRKLGNFDAAWPLQQQALDTRRRLLGADAPATLDSLRSTGELLFAQNRLPEAEVTFGEALAAAQRVFGAESRQAVLLMGALGKTLGARRKMEPSETCLKDALGLSRRVFGDDAPETALCAMRLGSLFLNEEMLKEAEPWCQEAVARLRVAKGDDDADTAAAISNLAVLRHRQGRLAEAEHLYRETVDIGRRMRGSRDLWTLDWIAKLGLCLQAQGKLVEAGPLLQESLEGRRARLPRDHPETLLALAIMGLQRHLEGDSAEAGAMLVEALRKERERADDDPSLKLAFMELLGAVRCELGEFDASDALLVEALAIRRGPPSTGEDGLSNCLDALGALRRRQGRLDEADQLLHDALEIRTRIFSADHPDTLTTLDSLGLLRRDQGRLAEADELLRDALSRRVRGLGEGHPDTRSTMVDLASVLCARSSFTEAEALLRRAEAITDPALPPRHRLRREIPRRFAELHEAWDVAEPGQGHAAQAAAWRLQEHS